MSEQAKKHRPASWTWTEYQDGEMITVTDGEQSAQTTRRTLAEAAEDAYDTLKGYFFAAPPKIPVEEYKATLKFLKFFEFSHFLLFLKVF